MIARMNESDLRSLNSANFNYDLSEADIRRFLVDCWALHEHDGKLTSPHAELKPAVCTGAHVGTEMIFRYPAVAEVLAIQLFRRLPRLRIDWVFGGSESYTLAERLARLCSAKYCAFSHVNEIGSNETVLQVEGLIRSREDIEEVRTEVKNLTGAKPINFLAVVACVAHLPEDLKVEYGSEVISLYERETWTVPSRQCKLCYPASGAPSKRLSVRKMQDLLRLVSS